VIGEHHTIEALNVLSRDQIKEFANRLKNAPGWRIVRVKFAHFNPMKFAPAEWYFTLGWRF